MFGLLAVLVFDGRRVSLIVIVGKFVFVVGFTVAFSGAVVLVRVLARVHVVPVVVHVDDGRVLVATIISRYI